MTPRRIAGAAVLPILVAGLAGGCGTIRKDKQELGLQAATTGYQSAVRWGYRETAWGYLPPAQREGKTIPDTFKGIRVTGYDVVQPPLALESGVATQVVDIEYLHEDRQVVKHLTDRQTWRWDEKLQSWWLESGLPQFQ